jgi:hypothetical protein
MIERVNGRLAAVCGLLVLGAGSGAGCLMGHTQREGSYDFIANETVIDDCGLLPDPKAMWDGELLISGDVIRMVYDAFDTRMVGTYLEATERFSADGSASNVTAPVRGKECLLDFVTLHLDASTQSPTRFSGSFQMTYEQDNDPSCVCTLLVRYTAVRK